MARFQSVFKKIYKVHTYLGLFVAFHFLILGVTGFILLMKGYVESEPAMAQLTGSLSPAQVAENYQKIYLSAQSEVPDGRVLALFADDENPTLIHARIGTETDRELRGSERRSYDLMSGAELKAEERASHSFFDWVLRLHREFLLGSTGKLYMGFIGFLYVFMLISGFFIYGRFMKNKSFGDVRPHGTMKMRDLHKYVGVVTFGWSLVVGLTGVFLAFNGVLIKFFQLQSLGHLTEKYQEVSEFVEPQTYNLKSAVLSALAANPDQLINYISFPETEFGIHQHFLFLMNPAEGFMSKLSEMAVVHASSSTWIETLELPFYLKIVLLSEPLHFGDYGGIFLHVLWGLFTLGSLAVVAFGVSAFWMRKRKAKTTQKRSVMGDSQEGTYTRPTVLTLISVFALIATLVFEGLTKYVALGFLAFPLIYASIRYRRRSL